MCICRRCGVAPCLPSQHRVSHHICCRCHNQVNAKARARYRRTAKRRAATQRYRASVRGQEVQQANDRQRYTRKYFLSLIGLNQFHRIVGGK